MKDAKYRIEKEYSLDLERFRFYLYIKNSSAWNMLKGFDCEEEALKQISILIEHKKAHSNKYFDENGNEMVEQ
jgi:hypothetical protein